MPAENLAEVRWLSLTLLKNPFTIARRVSSNVEDIKRKIFSSIRRGNTYYRGAKEERKT
jgi:hypothetical protein